MSSSVKVLAHAELKGLLAIDKDVYCEVTSKRQLSKLEF